MRKLAKADIWWCKNVWEWNCVETKLSNVSALHSPLTECWRRRCVSSCGLPWRQHSQGAARVSSAGNLTVSACSPEEPTLASRSFSPPTWKRATSKRVGWFTLLRNDILVFCSFVQLLILSLMLYMAVVKCKKKNRRDCVMHHMLFASLTQLGSPLAVARAAATLPGVHATKHDMTVCRTVLTMLWR